MRFACQHAVDGIGWKRDAGFGNPAVISQLRALIDARPELTAVAAGPTREELAA